MLRINGSLRCPVRVTHPSFTIDPSTKANPAGQAAELTLARIDGRTASLADQVADAVRAGVRSGDLVPGRLYSAYQLAEIMGISRSPVREALMRLAEAGMVSLERSRGFRLPVGSQRQPAPAVHREASTGGHPAARRLHRGHVTLPDRHRRRARADRSGHRVPRPTERGRVNGRAPRAHRASLGQANHSRNGIGRLTRSAVVRSRRNRRQLTNHPASHPRGLTQVAGWPAPQVRKRNSALRCPRFWVQRRRRALAISDEDAWVLSVIATPD